MLIAAIVRLDSPGPTLFFPTFDTVDGGRIIRCAQFSHHARCTRLGYQQASAMTRAITAYRRAATGAQTSRRTMPQLYKCCAVDMSLVGPRPPTLLALKRPGIESLLDITCNAQFV